MHMLAAMLLAMLLKSKQTRNCAGKVAPVPSLEVQGGPPRGLPGERCYRGRSAARQIVPSRDLLQYTEGREGREEGTEAPRRHPPIHIAQRQQRPRGIHQQQDQGDGEDGLRVQEHRQPRGLADASMPQRQASVTLETKSRSIESRLVLRSSYHTNYRSLFFCQISIFLIFFR